MPTELERLATLEAEVGEIKRQLLANGSMTRWVITTLITAAAAYAAARWH